VVLCWVSVAFEVDGVATSGAIFEASGPAEAPELVTATQPPTLFWQLPVPDEPRASGDTDGSTPEAELSTDPVHEPWAAQLSEAPDAEAADGPDPSFAELVVCPKAAAAPGPVEATDTVCGSHAAPPAVHEALPLLVSGLPVDGFGLEALEVAVPAHPLAPAAQFTDPEATDTAEGPLAAGVCPGKVTLGAEDASLVVCAWQPPCLTWQLPDPSADLALPPSTEASEPLPEERTLPEHTLAPAGQLVEADPLEVLTNSSPPA
jgi:hypothetical protein